MTWGQLTRRSRTSLDQIAAAVRAGGIGASTVPRRVERHLRNSSCKAVALRRITEFAEADKRAAMEHAERMDLFQPHRSKIRWRYEPKGFRGYRKVCDLPPRLRVAQHMAKDLIRAQHTPRDHIFDWPDRGGCPGAVGRTRAVIEDGFHFLVVADIRDCYENFNPAFIYQINLLPPELVRATLDSRQFRYGLKGSSPVPYSHDNREHARPRGLLQGGAASSTLLAYALDDLPDHLPSDVLPIVQSDNIILACRSQQECEAAADALGRYLSDNPAGAFSPRIEMVWMRRNMHSGEPCSATPWSYRFEQFGYAFQLDENSRCQIGLSQANLMKVAQRIDEYLDGLSPHQRPIRTFDDELREQLAGFPALSANSVEFINTLLEPEYVLHLISRQTVQAEDAAINGDPEPPWDE